jgi:hypothetical protein
MPGAPRPLADPPHVTATADPDAKLVPISARFALPARFFARIQPADPDLPACELTVVVEHGRPVCEELRLQRTPGGPPLGGTLLRRVPVADYVRRATDALGQQILSNAFSGQGPFTITADGATYPLPVKQLEDGRVATRVVGLTGTTDYRAATRAPRERGRVSDDTLRQVAHIYRTAHAQGAPPTRAVMQQMHVSRTTAGRWVARARQRGYLRPARPRAPGEIT